MVVYVLYKIKGLMSEVRLHIFTKYILGFQENINYSTLVLSYILAFYNCC